MTTPLGAHTPRQVSGKAVGNDKQRRFSPHAAITSAAHLFIQEPADYGDCDTGKRYDYIAKVNDGVVAVAFGLEL